MTSVSITKARANLYKIIASFKDGEAPVFIMGKKGNAVLLSEDDWRSIAETLYLYAIPGMPESIKKGMKEPISVCSTSIDL